MFPFPFSFIGAAAEPPELELIDNDFAMEFNGSDEYLNAGVDLTSFSDITVSLWVKWNSFLGTYQYIFSNGTTNSAGQIFGIAKVENSGANANKLYTYNGGGSITLTSQVVSIGTWYHVVVTQSGTTKKVYVNGSEISSFTSSALNLNNISYIGRYSFSNNYYLTADVDEVAVWNKALDATDIQTIYNATNDNPGKCANLWSGGLGTGLVYWNRMGD